MPCKFSNIRISLFWNTCRSCLVPETYTFQHGCLVISNHFPSKGLDSSSNWNNHIKNGCLGYQVVLFNDTTILVSDSNEFVVVVTLEVTRPWFHWLLARRHHPPGRGQDLKRTRPRTWGARGRSWHHPLVLFVCLLVCFPRHPVIPAEVFCVLGRFGGPNIFSGEVFGCLGFVCLFVCLSVSLSVCFPISPQNKSIHPWETYKVEEWPWWLPRHRSTWPSVPSSCPGSCQSSGQME